MNLGVRYDRIGNRITATLDIDSLRVRGLGLVSLVLAELEESTGVRPKRCRMGRDTLGEIIKQAAEQAGLVGAPVDLTVTHKQTVEAMLRMPVDLDHEPEAPVVFEVTEADLMERRA